MPQIILQERIANVVSYTFFTRDVDQYQNTPLSQLYQPPRTAFSQDTYHLLLSPCEFGKVLRTGFFIEHLQKQSFTDIPHNRVTPLFLKISQTSQGSTCVGISF